MHVTLCSCVAGAISSGLAILENFNIRGPSRNSSTPGISF